MSRSRVTIDSLADAVMEGLTEYADLATDDMKVAVRKAGKTAAPAKAASPANPASKDNRSPLEIENAVLRERIAKLEAKIQKLQSAITELMK